jgi:hypothetical protein
MPGTILSKPSAPEPLLHSLLCFLNVILDFGRDKRMKRNNDPENPVILSKKSKSKIRN